ncbi:MAG: hypothetical protein ACYSSM_07335 [Planctomycetota bacterium]|jgi:hypothetical protein
MSKTAKQFWAEAEKRSAAINRTYVEIQQGPNPLTPAELRKLAAKRPEVWARFVRDE